MSHAVMLPLLIPFTTALLLLFRRENETWQRAVSGCGITAMLAASFHLLSRVMADGVAVAYLGHWPAPFGIVMAADVLGALMTLVTATVGLSCVLFAFFDIGRARMRGAFYSLFFFLLFGVNGAFLTGDIFNLFVFYEIVLMSSYALTVLGNEKDQVRYGFAYLTINFLGSSLFLVAAGLFYRQLGTLNMAHAAERIAALGDTGMVTMALMVFFCVFALKSAVFPIFNWLPGAYSAPPTPVSALFAGLLTKVGVYSIYRVFSTVYPHDLGFIHGGVIGTVAGATMLFGVWGAMIQYDIKYILAFHSVSQVGYMLAGLALFSPLGLAAGIFHMVHHSLVKSSLFLIGGAIESRTGTQDLKKLGGLSSTEVPLSIFFLVSALALAGIPPLSGFFSKYGIVVSAMEGGRGWLVLVALLTSLFTLYSMLKIWRLGFWGETPATTPAARPEARNMLLTCGVGVMLVTLMTFFASPLMRVSRAAADDLLSPQRYIDAVLHANHPHKENRP